MTTETLDISEARKEFTRLDQRLRKNRVIWVTRRNEKAFAVVGIELMEAVLETLEVLNDRNALRMLEKSLEDIRHGRVHDHENLKKELL
jgi:PHD/YefM family antitoxin component YafN of YafNO toxin-antitoxin module